jgi:single-stranded DNA-specific DHH superfamily exonuclease
MAAGDLTITVVGTYASLALAVAAMDAGNDALVTDHHDLVILPGSAGTAPFAVLKYVRAAA